ncbi:MAG: DNA replication and repair protein RecF [Acidobacteria bacterium]|jgi:DNA replication and repair protein RecF|nr:DNA replication and repair protein RecF [Acidobacteriota bacterium]
MKRVELEYISTWNFRNLAPERVDVVPGVNMIVGGNGEGKTNLLEAITVLCNLRSFRARTFRNLVSHGETAFRLGGALLTRRGAVTLQQNVELGPPLQRKLAVDGSEVSAASYLQLLPVEVLSHSDRELVVGEPERRRAFTDRFAFLLRPALYSVLLTYRRLLRQRNAALTVSGDGVVEALEEQLADAAATIVTDRRRAVDRVGERFGPIFRTLRQEGAPDLEVRYRAESWLDAGDENGVAEAYKKRYAEHRSRDREAGFTSVGPHRHDLVIETADRGVRDFLSSGQIRVAAAALRLAVVEQLEQERGDRLPVLIDDVDAELDEGSLERLLERAGEGRQLLVTSARADRLPMSWRAARTTWMRDGACLCQSLQGETL